MREYWTAMIHIDVHEHALCDCTPSAVATYMYYYSIDVATMAEESKLRHMQSFFTGNQNFQWVRKLIARYTKRKSSLSL